MSDGPTTWERKYYAPGGGEPFLFYVVFGEIDTDAALSRGTYRCEGIAPGLDLEGYDQSTQPEVLDGFRQGYLWDELKREDPTLAAAVDSAKTCLVLRGSPADDTTLDYLRDTVGLLQFFLDHGGVAVYDPQMFRWWHPVRWRAEIFEPAAPVPRQHVVILVSEETDGRTQWYHTRGLRKFGRPDISVHHVTPDRQAAIVDLCNRFIEFQALGGVVQEGQEISVPALPPGGIARHGGDLDDPDFNNVHIDVRWPDGSAFP